MDLLTGCPETYPRSAARKGTPDTHSLPPTPGPEDLKQALEVAGGALRSGAGSDAPSPGSSSSDDILQAPAHTDLAAHSLDPPPQAAIAAARKQAVNTQISTFLSRFQDLAFPNLPRANAISETLQNPDHLHRRIRRLQSACSKARLYPNPTSFNRHLLREEARCIQEDVTRLASSAEEIASTLQAWIHAIESLTREINLTPTLEGWDAENKSRRLQLLHGLRDLHRCAAKTASQSSDHVVLAQYRVDGFAVLAREAGNLPCEASVVVQQWFPAQRQRLLGGEEGEAQSAAACLELEVWMKDADGCANSLSASKERGLETPLDPNSHPPPHAPPRPNTR